MLRAKKIVMNAMLLAAMSPLASSQIVSAQGESPAQEGTVKNELSTENLGGQENASGQAGARNAERMTAAMTVRELLLWKLTKASEAQVELANMAREKFENEQLIEYTKQVIDDHAQLKNERVAASSETTSAVRERLQARRGNASNENERVEGNAGERREEVFNRDERVETDRRAQRSRRNAMQQVPLELCQIVEQATENSLRQKKELLGIYEGQDFQMAYLGQQAVALTMSLAELEAIQASPSFQDLKPIVQQTISVTKRHVDMAKHLADQFEKDRK